MTDQDTQEALLQYARRQTHAIETIQSAVMLLLALVIVGGLIGLGFLLFG